MAKKDNKSLPYEKASNWFSKKIEEILSISKNDRINIEVNAKQVFMNYETYLDTRQDKCLNARKIFSDLRQSTNIFFKSLHPEIGIDEQFEAISYFAEGIVKCRQEYKKYQKELLTQEEKELERLSQAKPLIPFPEETLRRIDEYRKKRIQGGH